MAVESPIPRRPDINRLFMALIIAAAKGDKEKVYKIARRIVDIMESEVSQGLEDASQGQG